MKVDTNVNANLNGGEGLEANTEDAAQSESTKDAHTRVEAKTKPNPKSKSNPMRSHPDIESNANEYAEFVAIFSI